MLHYNILIHEDAVNDIQEIVIWYNNQQQNLGNRFKNQLIKQINSLKKNPMIFSIRYDNIRCMLVKKFPFLIHFSISTESKTVSIFAVLHTSRNPKIWENTSKRG